MEGPQAYDIPTIAPEMTPDQAKQALDKIHDQVAVDRLHPYVDGHHGQHGRMVAAMAALHEVWSRRPGGDMSDTARACTDALANQKAVKDSTLAEAVKEITILNSLGFSGSPPESCEKWELDSLRLQRLNAQRNFTALEPLLERQLRDLKQPSDVMAAYQSFVDCGSMDADLKTEIGASLIKHIHGANAKRYGKPKPRTQETKDTE